MANKKILVAAVAGVLFAGSARAAVVISATAPVPAVIAAESVVDPVNGLDIANSGNALDLVTALQYSFSDGEVRHARIECSDNMVFDTAPVAVGGTGTAHGVVNGAGASAIYFTITGGTGTNAADTITVGGDRTVDSKDPVSCTYGLYDTASQAVHGGSNGLIASASGAYLDFAGSYAIETTPATNTADVEADPAFSDYDPATAALAGIGQFQFGLAGDFTGGTTPINPVDGQPIALGDILHPDTALVFGGDFSLAVDADGAFDTGKVFLKQFADCTGTTMGGFDAVDATSATIEFGGTPVGFTATLCYQSAGGEAIPVADYTVSVDAVAVGTDFDAPDIAATDLGAIVHNGTELQAPLVNVPTGWISRLALTNTGNADRAYTIAVQTEDGVSVDTGNLSGVIKANSTRVIDDLATVLTGFSAGAKARATLNVNVAGPNAQIQGQYQLVGPEGSLSNYVLVRPGMN